MMERIKKIFASPVFEDSDKTRRAYMLNLVTWIYFGLAILAVGSSLAAFGDQIANIDWVLVIYYVGLFLIAVIIGQVLMRRGYVRLGSTIFVILVWLQYTIIVFSEGGIFSSSFMSYFVVILLAGLLLSVRASIVAMTASIISGSIAMVLHDQGVIKQFVIESTTSVQQFANVTLGFVIGTLVLYLFVRQLQGSQEETQVTNQKLEEARQALEVQVNVKTRGLQLAGEVGRELAYERDLDRLLERAVDAIQAQFDLYYVQIYLADAGQHRLMLRAGTGDVGDALVARGHRLAFGAGSINGAAASTREPIVVSDTAANPLFRPNALLPDTKAEMSLPLIAADRVVGVLNVQSNEAYGLTTDDFATYIALAGQLAIAIENAHLFAEINAAQQAVEMESRHSTLQNWEAYLDAITHHERYGYSYDGLTLESVAIDANERVKPLDEGLVIPIIVNGELIGSIAVEAEELADTSKVLINAVAQQIAQQTENLRLLSDSERYRNEAEEAVRRLTRESWEGYEPNLKSPGYEYDQDAVRPIAQDHIDRDEAATLTHDIKIHGEAIGSLEICDVNPDSIEAEALLASVTSVLGAHIENLRLAEQTEIALAGAEKRGADLNLINRVVSLATESLDLEYTLQAIADELGSSLGYDRISISLIDILRNSFTITAEYVSGVVERRTKGMTFSLDGDSFISEVMRSKKPVSVSNIRNTPSTSPAFEMVRAMGMEMFAVLPMMAGQDVIGTVSLASRDSERALTEDEIQLLQTMIRQIATAVQNAQLFTETQQRARRDQILNEITARVYTAVDADSILQTAVKEINRQLGLETYVYLDEDVDLEPQTENGSNGHQS